MNLLTSIGWGPEPGVSTPFGAISTWGMAIFRPRLAGIYISGRISDPGMGPYPLRARRNSTKLSQSAIGRWRWGFHTVRGGVDPGDHFFRPWLVDVAHVSKDFLFAH